MGAFRYPIGKMLVRLVALVLLPVAAVRVHSAEELPFVFGVLADVQYADKDTAGARHYRTSLDRLAACVDDFNQRKPAFVIQLGDLIDGHPTNALQTAADLDRVLAAFNRLSMPVYHVVGNHCLTAGREALLKALRLERTYYTFTHPGAKGWRFIVLDGNDAGYGVMSGEQLAWFRAELDRAKAAGERVICFCHFALLKEAAAHHRMAEPKPVLEILDAAGCVAAWFTGHDHAGGYALRNGAHHVTLAGMVEAPEKNAYALIELKPDRLVETGFGQEPSRELPLPAP